jgi:hypothetical protein
VQHRSCARDARSRGWWVHGVVLQLSLHITVATVARLITRRPIEGWVWPFRLSAANRGKIRRPFIGQALPAARAVWALIAATLVLRVVFALALDLGIDESYTVATSRQLQLSYFDHPPTAWWLCWGARHLFGTEDPLALRLPFILSFALTTWLTFRLTTLLFGDKAGLWAAVTLNLAPVIGWTSGTWILPDGPLNVCLVAGAYAVARAAFGPQPRAWFWWLMAGACGGLALLSKLHGAFLFAGIGVFLLSSAQHRCALRTPWPYLGALLAGVIFLPVIVWNVQHDWISFTFQASRAQPQGLNLLGPFQALGEQAVYLLPSLWLPMAFWAARAAAAGTADPRRWMMVCLGMGPIILFTGIPLTGAHVLPHWPAPGYLMLFPLLGAGLASAAERYSRHVCVWLIGTAASLTLALAAVVAMALLPWPSLKTAGGKLIPYPFIGSLGWKEFKTELNMRGLSARPGLFVAATRWYEAGKIDYALGGRLPVLCLCWDPRGYGLLTRPKAHLGEDGLIVVGRNLSPERVAATYGAYFESLEEMPPIVMSRAGQQVLRFSVYLGHRLHAPPFGPNLLDPLSLEKVGLAGRTWLAGSLSRPRRPLSRDADPASYPIEPLAGFRSS